MNNVVKKVITQRKLINFLDFILGELSEMNLCTDFVPYFKLSQNSGHLYLYALKSRTDTKGYLIDDIDEMYEDSLGDFSPVILKQTQYHPEYPYSPDTGPGEPGTEALWKYITGTEAPTITYYKNKK